MRIYPAIALALTALTVPVAAKGQEGQRPGVQKPKEIVVVGPRTADADAPIVLGRVYNDPTRALLLEPPELAAIAQGKARFAVLETPDGPFAEALREALEKGETLDELSLGAAQPGERAGYHTITLKNVRVTSISPGDRYGRVKVQFHWDRAEAAGAPLVGQAIGNLAGAGNDGGAAEPAPGQGWYTTRPYVSLVVDGHEIAQFSELAGIDTSAKPATIVLKRGKTRSPALGAWLEAVQAANTTSARKNGSIVVYDTSHGKPIHRWDFTNAWPSKVEIAGLAAQGNESDLEFLRNRASRGNEVAMEEVTIVCEHIQRVTL